MIREFDNDRWNGYPYMTNERVREKCLEICRSSSERKSMESKPRILYLQKILLERTDEENMLSTTQLINILNDEYGISAHRTTITKDIAALQEFAFMGQQYHLEVGGKDFYIDLLFYNTKLRCYVAIDLKTGEFKPEQAGKMNFYLSALDDLVKAPEDNPSVGLILCRDENRTIAEYALRDMSKPIGVSEYHLCTDLPLDLKNALPAVEDIRSRIDMKK